MVEADTRRRRCRPAKAILLENFRIKADPAAIPPNDPDTVRPFRPFAPGSRVAATKRAFSSPGQSLGLRRVAIGVAVKTSKARV